MEQRISLITLGVRDMERAEAFYTAMGWQRVESEEGIVAFDLIGQTLALYPLADLARDMGVDAGDLGAGAATYAYNVRDKEEVARALEAARAAGAKILREVHDVFWGGHIGYFADPEDNLWEVAHNPQFPIDESGNIKLPA